MATKEYNDYQVQAGQVLGSSALNHNVDLVSSKLFVNPGTTLDTITGFAPPVADTGGAVQIMNMSTGNRDVRLVLNSTDSSTANRVNGPPGLTEIRLAGREKVDLCYMTSLGWVVEAPSVTLNPVAAVVAPSTAVPVALAPAGAVGSSAGYARGDHVHPLPTIAVNSAPGRALATTAAPSPWQVSADKYAMVNYSAQITCAALLIAGQDGRIDLVSDASTNPTTIRASMRNANSGVLSLTSIQMNPLTYIVPPGHYVGLFTRNLVGTPSFSLVTQTEHIIG